MEIVELLERNDSMLNKDYINKICRGKNTTNVNRNLLIVLENGFYIYDHKREELILIGEPGKMISIHCIKKNALENIYNDMFHLYQKRMLRKKSLDRGNVSDFFLNPDNLGYIKAFILVLRPVLQQVPTLIGGLASVIPGLPAAGVGGVATGAGGAVATGITVDFVLDMFQLIITLLLTEAQLGLQILSLIKENQNYKDYFKMAIEHTPIESNIPRNEKFDTWFKNIGIDFDITKSNIVSFNKGPIGVEQKMKAWMCNCEKKIFVGIDKSCNLVNSLLSSLNTIISSLLSVVLPDAGVGAIITKGILEIGKFLTKVVKIDIFNDMLKLYNKIPLKYREKTKESQMKFEQTGFLQDASAMNDIIKSSIFIFRELIVKIFVSEQEKKNKILDKIRQKFNNLANNLLELIDNYLINNTMVFSNFIMIIQSLFWQSLWFMSVCNKKVVCKC